MEELKQLKQKLGQERPASWSELPDIALYMDQLISYMPRQLIRFDGEELLTAAMVNNYIKDGLVPRAEGKRYGKSHLAFLTVVCALKKVLSVKDMKILLETVRDGKQPQDFYEQVTAALNCVLAETAKTLDEQTPEEELPQLALELALRSYADQLACARVLNILRSRHPEMEAGKEKSKKRHEEGESERG